MNVCFQCSMGTYESTDQSHSFIDMINAHPDQSYTCYRCLIGVPKCPPPRMESFEVHLKVKCRGCLTSVSVETLAGWVWAPCGLGQARRSVDRIRPDGTLPSRRDAQSN